MWFPSVAATCVVHEFTKSLLVASLTMTIECKIESESDTVRLAVALQNVLPPKAIVSLNGTLGAGKTRLVRAFAEACGVPAEQVTSPTFTLWQTYQSTRTIHHLDAYRIADEDEFDALGFEDCFEEEAITFVEWAGRVAECLPRELEGGEIIAIELVVGPAEQRTAKVCASEKLEAAIQSGYETRFS